MPLSVEASIESWPIAQTFRISRGAKDQAVVVVAKIEGAGAEGRGECVPYARYGETAAAVRAAILGQPVSDRTRLLEDMPPGAARNAIDCALWDREAKLARVRAAQLAGLAPLAPVLTAFTISLDAPDVMAAKAHAAAAAGFPLLKLKLGGKGDRERIAKVRSACPTQRLIADANESWTPELLAPLLAAAAEARLELIEQPLPAGADDALGRVAHPLPICADEAFHSEGDLSRVAQRYEAVNIKLDKAGGLTAALTLLSRARAMGLRIMVGSMVATSLAIAPALLVAQSADWVDLDGALLLARDREPALDRNGALLSPPEPRLWG
jgi:L-alanine-DL-glutamate epimerase-like enolase superfamily enzyme